MARISGIDLPRRKQIAYALPYIYGVGRATALKICELAGVPVDKRVDDLSDADVKSLRDTIEAGFKVEGDARFSRASSA
jgi:small subunit ribosomal protein S13